MKVKIEDIDKDGLDLDIVEDLKRFNAASEDSRIIRSASLVKASTHIRRFGNKISIDGFVDVGVILKCARCLVEFESRIHSVLDLIFLEAPEDIQKEGERELKKQELDIIYYTGAEINIFDILSDEIILNLPVKPLCMSDCKGLCVKCGADLNANRCNCKEEKHIDFRLKKLKEFKIRR